MILIPGGFANAKLLMPPASVWRMSYSVRNSIIKIANLFRIGIHIEESVILQTG